MDELWNWVKLGLALGLGLGRLRLIITVLYQEGDLPDASQLVQYYLHVTDDEQRFAILLAMLKLKLIVGRSIIFVKNPERCYK